MKLKITLVNLSKREVIYMWIYRPYITKNGIRIYRKNGKMFRFWVDDDKVKQQ